MNKKDLKRIFADDPEFLKTLELRENNELLSQLLRSQDNSSLVKSIKKIKGEKGDTPVKGVDYMTDEEKEEFKQVIIESLRDTLTPIKGKDYFTEDEIIEFAEAVTPKKGVDYFDGKDADENRIVSKLSKLIPTKEEIASQVKVDKIDLEKIAKDIISRIPKQEKVPTIEEVIKELKKKQHLEPKDIKGMPINMNDMRWHGGGLSRVTHDATLTGDGTPSSPLSVVSSSGLELETNGTPNGSQVLLNLQQGTNITLTDNGTGTVTIDATGGGTTLDLEVNGTPNGDQTLLNLVEGTNMTITDDGLGNITFDATGGGGAVDSVNGQTGVVVLDADDISDAATTNKFVTAADLVNLSNLSGTNTGDVTVTDSAEIDFTLAGQNITASIVAGSIDETKLDASVNASLDLADTAVQPGALSSYVPYTGATGDVTLGIHGLVANEVAVTGTTVPTNGIYLPSANTVGFANNSTGRVVLSTTSLEPVTTNAVQLGSSGQAWADLFLGSGGVIDFNSGDVQITAAANQLSFVGATNGYRFGNGPIVPVTNDGTAIGTTALQWSDLFLASGAVVNFANGNATITHSSGIIDVTVGDLQVSSPGTAADSVLTQSSTNTVTNKTMTGATNTLTASLLKSATSEVSVSAATAPSSGQVLTATSSTTATWQNPSAGGTVTSVSGTTDRITITGTPTVNPTVDIASTYVGQSSITTLGTVTTGTWNGTVIAGQYGGTGVANTGKTITVSGNTTIGSTTNTVTLATTGNTSVTLPTTGTLATTSDLTAYLDKANYDPAVINEQVLGISAVQTVTNKRIQPRTSSTTSNASLTPDLSSDNVYFRTTQTVALAINAPTGTPVIGEVIAIYVDSASAQTLTIDSIYKPFGAAFPASTTAGKTFMMTAQYNGTDWKTLWANAI